jgi:hypothetical protein
MDPKEPCGVPLMVPGVNRPHHRKGLPPYEQKNAQDQVSTYYLVCLTLAIHDSH